MNNFKSHFWVLFLGILWVFSPRIAIADCPDLLIKLIVNGEPAPNHQARQQNTQLALRTVQVILNIGKRVYSNQDHQEIFREYALDMVRSLGLNGRELSKYLREVEEAEVTSYEWLVRFSLSIVADYDRSFGVIRINSYTQKILQHNSSYFFIPMTGATSIRLINYMQTMGVYPLGISTKNMIVDGLNMTPYDFLNHDIFHQSQYILDLSRLRYSFAQEQSLRKRNLYILKKIDKISDKKLKMAMHLIHFFFFHEIIQTEIYSIEGLLFHLDAFFARDSFLVSTRNYFRGIRPLIDITGELKEVGVRRSSLGMANFFANGARKYRSIVIEFEQEYPDHLLRLTTNENRMYFEDRVQIYRKLFLILGLVSGGSYITYQILD